MADWYLYSGAAGTGAGTSWVNAFTTMKVAGAAMAIGDTLWVASDHAESSASAQVIVFPGQNITPTRVISVNRAGSVPPVAADILDGATVTTTGASSINLPTSVTYIRGVTFNCGTGASVANITINGVLALENCALNLKGTNGSSVINVASGGDLTTWTNVTVSFGAVGQGLNQTIGAHIWTGGGIAGSVGPTTLMKSVVSNYMAHWRDLDLTLMSGKTLFANNTKLDARLLNCSLPASVTVQASNNNDLATAYGIRLIGCNSSGNVERNELYGSSGVLTTETTIIRTAGASDGTTAYSWKLVSNTQTSLANQQVLQSLEGAIWNGVTGSSRTLTFHCVTDNVTLKDSELWVEAEYLGSSGNPQASNISSGPVTLLATGTNLTSDSGEAWTTTGLTTPVKQKFSVTFTPQLVGPVRWRLKFAKASTTIYVDPNPDLS